MIKYRNVISIDDQIIERNWKTTHQNYIDSPFLPSALMCDYENLIFFSYNDYPIFTLDSSVRRR